MYCVALNKQDVSLSLSPLFIYLLTNLFIYVIGFLCRFFLFRFFFLQMFVMCILVATRILTDLLCSAVSQKALTMARAIIFVKVNQSLDLLKGLNTKRGGYNFLFHGLKCDLGCSVLRKLCDCNVKISRCCCLILSVLF